MQDDFPDDFQLDEEEPLFEEEEIEFEEEAAPPTQNRAFLIGVAVLAGLFVLSLCAVLLIIITRGGQPDPGALTNTAILQVLATTQAVDTQQAIEALTQAAVETMNAAATQTAEAERLALAATAQAQTATAAVQTATAEFLTAQARITETPTEVAEIPTSTPVPVTVVTETPGGPGTPTPGVPPAKATPSLAIPETGIADNLGLSGSLFVAGIVAIGLLAVMFVARRLRTGSYDDDDDV